MPETATQHPISSRLPVLGIPIDLQSVASTVQQVLAWAAAGESRYVCLCNVHSVVTARQDAPFRDVIAKADLAVADGAPVAWMLRRLGAKEQRRVSGPDLMLETCAAAQAQGTAMFLFGSTPETLSALQRSLQRQWPQLKIAGTLSPPYRPLLAAEADEIVETINASGAGIVWVGLGCPKQEHWMAAHRGRVKAVMLGVGAAFDFHAGTKARAPGWMRAVGLEWLHRLASEPARLGRRYLTTNSAFLLGALKQLAQRR
jgi:N-acetylglucosaminyldiphosphoundecaprenol N-acetyl-beta-D-mannosaminyltransferase